jgi:hypothetical protein
METPTIDVEPDDTGSAALELRRPDIPVTLSELAALKGEAVEIIEARVQVLATLRKASIRATSPEDWLLFKAPDEQGGQIVGYLQDCGCDRVRDLYGIEIFNVTRPEKVVGNDPGNFHYLISASGRCKLTRQVVEEMEGGRSSTDDFCRGKSGAELELLVRKAARANVDGNITRELAGMKSVPIADLKEAWAGTDKIVERCRLGRGFGTRDERVGGASSKAPDVEPPVCPHCNSKGVYRPAKDNRAAFYGCPNYNKHPQQKFIVNAAEWIAKQPAKPAAAAPPPPAARDDFGTPIREGGPLTADEVFGKKNGEREPGQDG